MIERANTGSGVVLLSGGLDSLAVLALSCAGGGPTAALHVRYGQKAESRELSAAQAQARHYGVELEIVDARFLQQWCGGGLFDGDLPLDGKLEGAEAANSASAVWVPGRNGLFVAIAASFAEARGMGTVLFGCNTEEASTFPDNSVGFVDSCREFLGYATGGRVTLEAPLQNMDKREIVETCVRLGAPLPLVWSCYSSGPVHCGRCESCLRLKRALSSAADRADGPTFLR